MIALASGILIGIYQELREIWLMKFKRLGHVCLKADSFFQQYMVLDSGCSQTCEQRPPLMHPKSGLCKRWSLLREKLTMPTMEEFFCDYNRSVQRLVFEESLFTGFDVDCNCLPYSVE